MLRASGARLINRAATCACGLDGIKPDAMNQVHVAWRERRRVCAKVIGIGAAAMPVDDESKPLRLWLFGPFPCFTDQTGLFVGSKSRGFPDVQVRRLQFHR